MPVIEVDGLTKRFGEKVAVDTLSFEVEEGEILVIVGASGCGKTTTLRAIAGLDVPSSGTIRVDGRTVVSDGVFVPPEKRGIGMVFQSYALWPHKTVFQNISYPLVVAGKSKADIGRAVSRTLDLVGLSGMEDRFPSTLSGGQQQRVALARCAVAEPRVLLLDEPLSNLDAKLREQMQFELKQLIKTLNSTAVHITHDQTEAMAIADRIIVMREGRAEQMGSGRDIYRRPVSRFVADFIGVASFIDGDVVETLDDGSVKVDVAGRMNLWARPSVDAAAQGEVTLCIRPEDVHIDTKTAKGRNVLAGVVTKEAFLGDHISYGVEIEGLKIRARSQSDFDPGAQVSVSIDKDKLICVPRDTARAAGAGAHP